MPLILTRQSFNVHCSPLVDRCTYYYRNWKWLFFFFFLTCCIYSSACCTVCLLKNVTHLTHLSLFYCWPFSCFLFKPINSTLLFLITPVLVTHVQLCHFSPPTTVGYDFHQHFPAICCPLILFTTSQSLPVLFSIQNRMVLICGSWWNPPT